MFDAYSRRIDYLRISVTDRCNLRCQYCMPAEGIAQITHNDVLRFEEIHAIVARATQLGIRKVRLTGGEPLVRKGILTLVSNLAKIEGISDFGMTTNGVLLAPMAADLKKAGLHRINVSLDTLDEKRYGEITRGGELSQTLLGIEAAITAGFVGTKLNCVIQDSPEEKDAKSVARFAKEMNLEVRYIRRMDTGKGEFWSVIGGEGGKCASCNRLRLSSNGFIYPCLFSDTSFSVRALGIDSALMRALESKPESGCRSNHKFHFIGG